MSWHCKLSLYNTHSNGGQLTKTLILDGLQIDNMIQLSCGPPVHTVETEDHVDHNNEPCDL